MHPPSAFGTFRVLHPIGSGVLGPVFRAYDSDRERLVVIKALRLDLTPSQVPVVVEALKGIVARPVDAAAVVRAVDAGLEGSLPYLALEFVSGESLDAVLRDARSMPVAAVTACCRAIAEAIDAAWDVGCGHGAMHPRDVFVRADGTFAITGFGVAQALESAGAKAPVRMPYAAPERVRGGDWDRRADIYALAAIGQQLSRNAGARSRGVAAAFDKGLADDPDRRYQSAQDLVAAIESAFDATIDSDVDDVPAPATGDQPVADVVLVPQPVGDAPLTIEHIMPLVQPATDAAPAYAPRFPWAAIAAVAVAGLAVGGLLGFRAGVSSATDATIEREVARAAARGSEPPVSPQLPEPPPVVRAPETTPVGAPPGSDALDRDRPNAAPGSIAVDSRPRGARVTVDGKSVGQTPLRVGSMSPGDHRVLIELQGHRRVASTVKVVAGAQVRLAVSLEQTELASAPRAERKRN